MTKKHFIEIADAIIEHNKFEKASPFLGSQLGTLADAFKRINPAFKKERWLDYIAGECGPNGGIREALNSYRSASAQELGVTA